MTKNSLEASGIATGFELTYLGKSDTRSILDTAPGTYKPIKDPQKGENRLYHADNLQVLAALMGDPEISGQVGLVYIDPPFGTAQQFESLENGHAYDDRMLGPMYIEELRKRLVFIHHLLANRGSLYLHLDERMVFHAKLILDEIFGPENLRNFITRRKSNPKNYTRKTYGNVSDHILFYTKSKKYTWNRPVIPWDQETAEKEYQYIAENGRRYKKVPVHAPGTRNGETGQPWRGKMPPPGKHWQYRPSTLEEMDQRGEIYWSPNNNPRRKVFLDEAEGIPVQDIWTDTRDAFNQNHHVTGYPTEKNADMLKRVISASSNEGDIVMDCYCGSGTTLEQASMLNRRWIGVDSSDQAITVTIKRLREGTRKMGDYVKQGRQLPLPNHQAIEDYNLYEELVPSGTEKDEILSAFTDTTRAG